MPLPRRLVLMLVTDLCQFLVLLEWRGIETRGATLVSLLISNVRGTNIVLLTMACWSVWLPSRREKAFGCRWYLGVKPV
jgi:hypothetical protein